MESGVREYTRLRKEGLNDVDATKQVVRDTNIYFGNIGRQGVFRSKTFQDLAKICFLAPQWFESMIRSEKGAVGQSIKAVGTLATMKKPVVGTLAKGTSALILATFAATQVANILSRGHPTWDNPEEDHKLDAWVPSVGGGQGFWVTPFSLPMEVTHDIIRYTEKGMSPLKVGSQIMENKAAPLFRAAEVLKTGKDFTGQDVGSDAQRWKTAGMNLLPLPLPAQPFVKGGYPGQVQRQLMASAGIKAEPASTPRSIVANLRRQFLYGIGKSQQPDYTPSEYQSLVQALNNNDVATAKQDYDKLLQEQAKKHQYDPDPQHEAMMDLQKHFKGYAESRGNATKHQEEAFVKTLTYHQKELYDKVVAQQKAVADLFFSQIQPDISNKPHGFKPPTFRRTRGFSHF